MKRLRDIVKVTPIKVGLLLFSSWFFLSGCIGENVREGKGDFNNDGQQEYYRVYDNSTGNDYFVVRFGNRQEKYDIGNHRIFFDFVSDKNRDGCDDITFTAGQPFESMSTSNTPRITFYGSPENIMSRKKPSSEMAYASASLN